MQKSLGFFLIGLLSLLCLLGTLFVGCKKSTSSSRSESIYSIVGSDTYGTHKRSLDVRLRQPVPENTLRTIALELKSQASQNYDRTFICYYLPGMVVDTGAWATTHFNPNLEVRILGLSVEQEQTLRKLPDDSSREIIGYWLDKSLYNGGRITIFHQNEKIYLEKTYSDGSVGKGEVTEKKSNGKRTFWEQGENSVSEHYLIDRQGNLQLWDNEGIIWTAKKIRQ